MNELDAIEFIRKRYGMTDIDSIIPVGNHKLNRNQVFRFEKDNTHYIFKLSKSRYKWENEIKSHLLLKELDFIPETLDYGTIGDMNFQLMDKKEGRDLFIYWNRVNYRAKKNIVNQMGISIAQIHDAHEYNHYGWWEESKGFTNIIEYRQFKDQIIVDRLIECGLSENKTIMAGINNITELRSQLKNEKTSIVHRDFSLRNILIKGDRVTGVVDFEHSRPDDPVIDICTVLQTDMLDDDEMMQSFFEGYSSIRQFPANFSDNRPYYFINRGLYVCSKYDYRKEDLNRGLFLIEKGLKYLEASI
ncbi:MAG: aminoglycoside phosphotransferase family protein [Dethiosulfatibacter sp.]|nr:aminoglycoside phosphotransferase family protein [Dethiosulfatibacter sp.]